MDVFDFLRTQGAIIEACGSRVTCRPAPVDTDEDWLVEIPKKFGLSSRVHKNLTELGYLQDTGNGRYPSTESTFASWRKESVNLIITNDVLFAGRHRAATHICKKLNLLNKADRIMVFQAVLYGNKA